MTSNRVPISEGLFRTEHDPMCPNVDLFQLTPITICLYCHVIDRVRKDQTQRCITAVEEKNMYESSPETIKVGFDSAKREMLRSLRALREKL